MWWLIACASEPAPVRSVPTEPLRDLQAAEPAVVFTDLADLFPETPASLPAALASLTPRQDGAAARAVLEAAHEPGIKLIGELGETQYALTTILRGRPTVSVTLLFDSGGTVLQEIDLALPDEVAVPMLTTRWGPPTAQRPTDPKLLPPVPAFDEAPNGAKMTLIWKAPASPWRAELIPGATRGKAILRYLPAAP